MRIGFGACRKCRQIPTRLRLETLDERAAPTDLMSILIDLSIPGYMLFGLEHAANIVRPFGVTESKVEVVHIDDFGDDGLLSSDSTTTTKFAGDESSSTATSSAPATAQIGLTSSQDGAAFDVFLAGASPFDNPLDSPLGAPLSSPPQDIPSMSLGDSEKGTQLV